LPAALTLAAGVILGWALAAGRPQPLRAHGGDRWGDDILASGPTFVHYNKGTQVQVTQDAIYLLDYRAGKLYGTVPSFRQLPGANRVIEGFAERDLVADFRLADDARPHFLMTTGSIGGNSGSVYSEGWAPLFVFETTTKKVASYKIETKIVGASSQNRLELLEVRPFGPAPVK
jgi:hypothetical protein